MDIAELLAFSVKNKASDLHLSAGLPPMIRVDGDVRRINVPAFDHKQVHALVYDIMSDKQRRDFEEFLEVDFSFEIPGLARFRVNAFNQNRGAGAVFRTIPSQVLTLEDLGCPAIFRDLIDQPQGLILVTGPTGSGKSTTLYATLTEISEPTVNIITVEDPVEYRMQGLNQIQVNPKAGLTFASALRSILRSDPDVVMVGEIRDVETAKMAIEAALTGHFVLSTLHTNDAPAALTRLNEMGVEPFLTGSAVTAVVAQRLARKLCTHCCEMYIPTREEMLGARFTPEQVAAADGVSLYRKKGCPRCNQTGYKGRIGIYQLMVMTEELSRLSSQHASREELERSALGSGMKTLWDDGLAKVASGLTSIEELGRVLVQ
jgi:twitching motility protein PilT